MSIPVLSLLQFDDGQDENRDKIEGKIHIYFWSLTDDFVPVRCCIGFLLQSPVHQMMKRCHNVSGI